MQDMEFTVEEGKLYMLQTRNGKRTPTATFRIAVDMVNEGLITREEALERITPEDIERLFYPVIDPESSRAELGKRKLAAGINAVPGAAVGKVVFTAHEAEDWASEGRKSDSRPPGNQPRRRRRHGRRAGHPDGHGRQDQPRRGGRARLGQVLHRWLRKAGHRLRRQKDVRRRAASFARANGSRSTATTARSIEGEVQLVDAGNAQELPHHDEVGRPDRRLSVRANADTAHDARKAREMGAEGIGLCRTEHMFFKDFEQPERSADRQLAIQEMIIAETSEARRKALAKLRPFQRAISSASSRP